TLALDDSRLPCVRLLDCSLANVSRVVHTKYSDPKYSRASIVVKNWADNGHHFYQSHEDAHVNDDQWAADALTSTALQHESTAAAPATSFHQDMQAFELKLEPENPTPATNENHLPEIDENMPDGYQQYLPELHKLPPIQRPRAANGFKPVLTQNHRWSENSI
ncbi:hypothetical protein BC938DRAFT_481517, partial [Jimgerdemannia flammicorona]